MEPDVLAVQLVRKHEDLVTRRRPYERVWHDIRDYIRPDSPDFYRGSFSPGQDRNSVIYDGTAMDALEQFASGLHSFLTNNVDRWFVLALPEAIDASEEELEWLEAVSDRIYQEYARPEANLSSALHETYLDLGSFGTGAIFQGWDTEHNCLRFRAEPLSRCFFLESHTGMVDTIHREMCYDSRQIMQMFDKLPPVLMKRCMDDKTGFKETTLVHCIYPRSDRLTRMRTATHMPIASVWLCLDTKEIISESGYEMLPYHVTRWTKMSSETYGRGPGHKCIPDIRMLNRMEFTMIKAVQKIVDPPLLIEDESMISPMKTTPGGLNYHSPGSERPEPLLTGGNIPVGVEFSDGKRRAVQQAYHVDWLRMEKNNVEMTATEVMDRREEKLRLLSPMVGRQYTELLGPMIKRSYNLLANRRRLPNAPESLANKTIKVSYTSPAATAQRGMRSTATMKFLQEVTPFVQLRPDVLDVIDLDRAMQELAVGRGVSRVAIRTPDEIMSIRKARAEQQQAQQQAEMAVQASQAMKNVAQANNLGGTQ